MKACAFVVGPPDGPGAALMDLARGLGFPIVLPYAGLAAGEIQAQQTPLLFFLFAAVENVATLKPVADQIRFSPRRQIRFSPLVYFSETPQVSAIQSCVEMGFDDVITLPFTRARVEPRLTRLIDSRQVYYETPGYLGPDRGARNTHEAEGIQYRRLEIVRSVKAGCNVVRDDMQIAI